MKGSFGVEPAMLFFSWCIFSPFPMRLCAIKVHPVHCVRGLRLSVATQAAGHLRPMQPAASSEYSAVFGATSVLAVCLVCRVSSTSCLTALATALTASFPNSKPNRPLLGLGPSDGSQCKCKHAGGHGMACHGMATYCVVGTSICFLPRHLDQEHLNPDP